MALGSGAASLAGVSTLMFVGSYLAGCLPALVKLGSPRQLQLVRPRGVWRASAPHDTWPCMVKLAKLGNGQP